MQDPRAFLGINPQNVAQLKVNERFALYSTNDVPAHLPFP
jgi:hypothetical protein